MLAAVEQNGYALLYASEELRADREFVLAAVRKDGHALLYASAELHADADREIVLAAVRQNGLALRYASRKLRNDEEVVSEAARSNAEKSFGDGENMDS